MHVAAEQDSQCPNNTTGKRPGTQTRTTQTPRRRQTRAKGSPDATQRAPHQAAKVFRPRSGAGRWYASAATATWCSDDQRRGRRRGHRRARRRPNRSTRNFNDGRRASSAAMRQKAKHPMPSPAPHMSYCRRPPCLRCNVGHTASNARNKEAGKAGFNPEATPSATAPGANTPERRRSDAAGGLPAGR